MGTLYDLLGALPDDNAEGLRTAFRKAAKATHPDLNPDNPEAALRFRQLVRAHDILSDAEQRATYDQLLAIAIKPPPSKSKHVYEKVHRFASSTIAATIISGILVASYTLMGLVSRAPVAAESTVGIAGASARPKSRPPARARRARARRSPTKYSQQARSRRGRTRGPPGSPAPVPFPMLQATTSIPAASRASWFPSAAASPLRSSTCSAIWVFFRSTRRATSAAPLPTWNERGVLPRRRQARAAAAHRTSTATILDAPPVMPANTDDASHHAVKL